MRFGAVGRRRHKPCTWWGSSPAKDSGVTIRIRTAFILNARLAARAASGGVDQAWRKVLQFEFQQWVDTVEKLDLLPRSQFLRQQAGFKKQALRPRQKG
jgi:hypothetical protein